jgi:hypothetical protein
MTPDQKMAMAYKESYEKALEEISALKSDLAAEKIKGNLYKQDELVAIERERILQKKLDTLKNAIGTIVEVALLERKGY